MIGSDLVAGALPILADTARQVSGVQIQNRGTLGGNLANASPGGDRLPALAEAAVVLLLIPAPASSMPGPAG